MNVLEGEGSDGGKVSRVPAHWFIIPNHGCPSPRFPSCLLRSHFPMPPPCCELFPLWFICEYPRLFQKGFQVASLPSVFTASKRHGLWFFFLGTVHLFQAGSTSCLVLSESLSLVQTPNPNLASLVIIINVLFTPSSRSLMKMLNETRMKPRPRGIPLDAFQQLDTLPFAVSLPFVYLASAGPFFWKRQKAWYFYCCRDAT